MKVVQINATCGIGSTGKICVGVSELLSKEGIENYILYSGKTNGYEKGIACSSDKYIKLQALKSRVFGNYGFNSNRATKKIINVLEKIKPDIVHLHNIHGHDCNLELLFDYLKKVKQKIVWTFHDCWAFTAYCPHFVIAKCDKWNAGCRNCPQASEYSFFFDRSAWIYQKKKELFADLDMTIVTPSAWLAGLVRKSFFKENLIRVINNGVDLAVFCPRESDFRVKYAVPTQKNVILGVAFGWGARKGLDVFVNLAKDLDPDKYQIVLVGTDEGIDTRLPSNIISIHRTQNQKELAEIYSAADLFVNPTREEVLGLTNIEANACGTPVLTFETGGSTECISPSSGASVPKDDYAALKHMIRQICEKRPYSIESCRAQAMNFEMNARYMEYLMLYEAINAK